MTRHILPRFLRGKLAAGLALAGLAVPALLLATSAAASAAPLPGPGFGLHPESFSIFVSTFDQQGSVFAAGPVRGFGDLNVITPTFVVLDLHHPMGTVDVRHSPAEPGTINWRTCTETAVTYGSWEFVGGTDHDWGAQGFGHFREVDFSVLHRGLFGQCEPFKAPRYFQVTVQANGLAAR